MGVWPEYGIMRNLVLKNQVAIGTVNADPDAFHNAISDLDIFHKRWPDAVRSIITGHHTHNFADAISTFRANQAVIQLPELPPQKIVDELFDQLSDLLENPDRRRELGRNAQAVMNANRGATQRTTDELRKLL